MMRIAYLFIVANLIITNTYSEDIQISSVNVGDTRTFSVSTDNNNIYLIWNTGLEQKIFLKYWDGKKWQALGNSAEVDGIADTKGYANYPVITAKDLGQVYLAWMDKDNVYLKFWNGKYWGDLKGTKNPENITNTNKGKSEFPSLALDAMSRPVIAFHEMVKPNSNIIGMRRWNGNIWQDFGNSIKDSESTWNCDWKTFPKIAIDKQDRIFVLWTGPDSAAEPTYGNGLFLRCWEKNQWNDLSSSSIGRGINKRSGNAEYPTMALDKTDNPVIAWKMVPITDEGFEHGRIYLLRWDGKGWIELAGSASGEGICMDGSDIRNISVAFGSMDNPIVAYQTIDAKVINILQWDGSKWNRSSIGNGKNNSCRQPTLINDSKGRIYLSWLDQSGEMSYVNFRIYYGILK